MRLLNSLKNKSSTLGRKVKSADKLLKISFLAGLAIFTLSIFLFKFEILAELSVKEYQRLDVARSLHNLIANPTDLFNGLLQRISVKLLPNHEIFALRLPVALMLLSSIGFIASSLYIRFRNRYLPYTYIVLAISSPWLILLAHQGYLPGIDLIFFLSLLVLSFLTITSTNLRLRRKSFFFIAGTASLASILLQPLGIPITIILSICLYRSTELKYQIIGFKKPAKLTAALIALMPIAIGSFIIFKNHQFIQIISGIETFKNPAEILQNLIEVTKSIFGIDQSKPLNSGTNRPDFLLIGALLLTIYEAIKKRRARLILLAIFVSSFLLASIYPSPSGLVLPAILVPTITGLAIANMVNIIDIAFPFNPYPRNIAKTAILLLITVIASLGFYTFTTATVRQNSPQKINLSLQKE